MKFINQISQAELYLEFLKSEWYSNRYDAIREIYDINKFNPANARDKELVFVLLTLFRNTLLRHLPKDTKWFLAKLDKREFENLTIIREASWGESMKRYDPYNYGRLKRVKDISKKILQDDAWCASVSNLLDPHLRKIHEIVHNSNGHDFDKNKLLLIKQPKCKIITVLEGNHRALAFCVKNGLKKAKYIPKYVIVGLSPNMDNCIWYNRKKL